jgi:hypothetical protein
MLSSKKIAILLFLTHSFINAYEFSFFNKTETPIAIAIQFANSEQEPLYKLYIKPGTMKSFVPGSIDIPDIKWSFCLGNLFYVKDPTMEQRAHNFDKIESHWKKASISWTDKPLETTKKQLPLKHKRFQKKPNLSQTSIETRRLVVKKTAPQESKSLCKDRHFEITQDQYGNIIIMGSTVE